MSRLWSSEPVNPFLQAKPTPGWGRVDMQIKQARSTDVLLTMFCRFHWELESFIKKNPSILGGDWHRPLLGSDGLLFRVTSRERRACLVSSLCSRSWRNKGGGPPWSPPCSEAVHADMGLARDREHVYVMFWCTRFMTLGKTNRFSPLRILRYEVASVRRKLTPERLPFAVRQKINSRTLREIYRGSVWMMLGALESLNMLINVSGCWGFAEQIATLGVKIKYNWKIIIKI